MRIDCDAHVDETEETWAHIPDDAGRCRPVSVEADTRMWMWPGRSSPVTFVAMPAEVTRKLVADNARRSYGL